MTMPGLDKSWKYLFSVFFFIAFFSTFSTADVDTRNVRVNQEGYLPNSKKVASIIDSSPQPLSWELHQSGKVVSSGNTVVYGLDSASQDYIHKADFSSWTKKGSYQLHVLGHTASVTFDIRDSLYPLLAKQAMEYFYLHRMGEPILAAHVSESQWARPALHPGDNALACYQNWCEGEILNVKNSWADAGDFGIYAVNHAISAWTLLNLLEIEPTVFADNSLNIPESGNGIPDILDEVVFGSTFMPGMLPNNKNLLASHKAHNTTWSAFPLTENAITQENALSRHVRPPSTNATYAVARTSAHIARLLSPHNTNDAASLWNAAKDSFNRASTLPLTLWTITGESGGGPYADTSYEDDRYAAAVEMYLTARALGDSEQSTFKSIVTSSSHFKNVSDFSWASVQGAATLSLAVTADNGLSANENLSIKENIKKAADEYLAVQNSNGYPTPYNPASYDWGSNSFVVNRMIIMAYAHRISGQANYLQGMLSAMDYLLGTNPMKLSYITGYGEFNESDTHDRLAWGYYQQGTPYPKGWLSGGPMTNKTSCVGESATPLNAATAKGYAAPNTAPSAWCSKENTINWNAPLVWVAAYIQKHASTSDPCSADCPPIASNASAQTTPSANVDIRLVANDVDGQITRYEIVDPPTFGSTIINTNNALYTASATYIGEDSFTYYAVDNDNLKSNIATVTVTITEPPSTKLTCEIGESNIWNSGFVLNAINVTNNGSETINGWTVRLPVEADVSIVNAWNASVTVQGNDIIASSENSLLPGQSTNFGMQGTHNGQFSKPQCLTNTP